MRRLAIVSAVALAVSAGAAVAKPGEPRVQIRDAVARVIVVVEDRRDVAVEVTQGGSGLPRLTTSRRGDAIVIDGDLGRRIRECRSGAVGEQPGQNASVEVRGVGRVALNDAPLIVIRSPRAVEVEAGGAVFGAVGRGASSIELAAAGCGDWTVANVDGPLTVSIGGSGDVRAGTSRALTVSVAGSGDVVAGASGDATISVAGSGDVRLARVNGDFSASIAGSGDIRAAGGEARRFTVSIAGSGDVDFRGSAREADVNIVGSGDVRIRAVSGQTRRSVIGSGGLRIGD